MDQKRKDFLLSRQEMGPRFVAFLADHQIKDAKAAVNIGVTNYSRYKNGEAKVSWEVIIETAAQLKIDPGEIVDYLDPGPKAEQPEIKITSRNRESFKNLETIFRDGDKRAIEGIVINLEWFCKAIAAERTTTPIKNNPARVEPGYEEQKERAVNMRALDRKKKRRQRGEKLANSHSPPQDKAKATG